MTLVVFFLVALFLILAMRLFGAWMLRIDDVIKGLKSIDRQLKQINDKMND